jgi:hypothetical protein
MKLFSQRETNTIWFFQKEIMLELLKVLN